LDAATDVASDAVADASGLGDAQAAGDAPADASMDGTEPPDATEDAASDAPIDSTEPADATEDAPGDASMDVSEQADAPAEAAVSSYSWVYQRIGDCSGNDRLAYTVQSDQPVMADCNATQVGTAAVCWDQTVYANSLLAGSAPGCTYKSVTAASCVGGLHPGFLWVCANASDAGVDAGPSPDAATPPWATDAGNWQFVRVDDCAGNDSTSIGVTTASDVPVATDCTPSNRGLACVCWDQTNYTNPFLPGSAQGCTYKTIAPASCTGGTHPGYMYICNAP
jgi:hypothetical protein